MSFGGHVAAVLVAAAALFLTACGLAPQEASNRGLTLIVTRDYGTRTLTSGRAAPPRGKVTALALLESGARVTVGRDGMVSSIDGVRGSWAYWVNGARQKRAPDAFALSPGDVLQFDLDAAPSGTAIVGAYPNPFVQGSSGARLPVHVECESDTSAACRTVRNHLTSVGVVPAAAELGFGAEADTLRVLVARWSAIRAFVTTGTGALDPAKSAVYARFAASGSALSLLDAVGARVMTVGAGSGLVAALAPPSNAVAWLVTGVDEAGVERAAAALDARTLAGAFAVAATPSGTFRLPLARPH